MSWLGNTARTIDEEPGLRIYGALLAACHALTAVAWLTSKHVASLVGGDDVVCWPLFAECWRLRPFLTPDRVTAAVLVYAALGATAAALFARRTPRSALLAFLAATIVGIGIYSLDYRLRLNQTYMLGWVITAFLFARQRRVVLPALVALFYVWAGTLKMTPEWLSGAALYAAPWLVPTRWIPAACLYVLVLEIALVPLLLTRWPALRWAVYGQLLLFHLTSFGVVGWFYPVLMLALTSIWPLGWRRGGAAALTWARLRDDAAARYGVVAWAAAFSVFQLVPYLFPGETAVTGEGRLFALHMFDARVACEGGAYVRAASGARAKVPLVNGNLDARTRCDPIVLLGTAQRLCRALAARGDAVRVDVAISAKRSTDSELSPLLAIDDLCARDLAYSLFRHNDWITLPHAARSPARASVRGP